MNEVLEFIGCCCVLDVVNNGLQNLDAKCARSQLWVKGRVDDSFENSYDCPELVGVRDNLDNGSVNAEMETSLNLESLELVANVFNHVIQLVEVLVVKANDVNQ
jgi:hypothetical protein